MISLSFAVPSISEVGDWRSTPNVLSKQRKLVKMVTKLVIDLKKYFVLQLYDIIFLTIFTTRREIGQLSMSQSRLLERTEMLMRFAIYQIKKAI